jgi:1,4-alpha-glucan branching enzyme
VPFVVMAAHAARVSIVGDFNDWDPAATPLRRAGAQAWWVVVNLRPGRYRYAFVVDGTRWIADPAAPRAADNDFGAESSVVTILDGRL